MRIHRLLLLFVAVLCFGSVACGFIRIGVHQPSDHSFAVEAAVVETNTIASVIGRLPRRSTPPAADIMLNGTIRYPWFNGINLPAVTLRNQGDGRTVLILSGSAQRMFWDGTITMQGVTQTAEVAFVKWTTSDGRGERFILRQAVLGQVSLDFTDPFDIEHQRDSTFPYLIGYAQTANSRYRIYAGRDNAVPSNTFGTVTVFFNMQQKFQFLDAQNRVVAELERGTLTLYNTLAASERNAIKEASALFTAFRHATIYTARNRHGWGRANDNWTVYP